MEYKCGVCGKSIEGDSLTYINHTEAHIMDEIESSHPDWVKEDGVCKKCVEYYRGQMKGSSATEG